MGISALALHGIITAGVISTIGLGIGTIIVFKDEISNFFDFLSGTTLNLTRRDEEFIREMGTNIHDLTKVNFSVKNRNTEVNGFPEWEGDDKSSLKFVISPTKDSLTIESKPLSSKSKNWECVIEFIKEAPFDKDDDLKEEIKNLIYKDQHKGLLGKISEAGKNEKWKKYIIELCAKNRGSAENKRLNEDETIQKLTSHKIFKLTKKGSGLELKDGEDKRSFQEWFIDDPFLSFQDRQLQKKLDYSEFNFEVKTQENQGAEKNWKWDDENELNDDFLDSISTKKKRIIVRTPINSGTWGCIFSFQKYYLKPEHKTSRIGLENRDKLISSNPISLGFFNKLKTNNNKDFKKKFINKCASLRLYRYYWKNESIYSWVTFELFENDNNKLEQKKWVEKFVKLEEIFDIDE